VVGVLRSITPGSSVGAVNPTSIYRCAQTLRLVGVDGEWCVRTALSSEGAVIFTSIYRCALLGLLGIVCALLG